MTVNQTAPPLPHSVEAERSVLGGILLNESAIDTAMQSLVPEDFFLSENTTIFAHMVELRNHRAPVDAASLIDSLQRNGDLEAAGGAAYISSLADGLPQLAHVDYYAQIVKDDAWRRLAIHRAEAIQAAAFSHEDIAEINKRFRETADAIRPAQEWIPTASAKAFCGLKLPSSAYLVDGLIKSPSMIELFSWRGVGKTMFALGLSNAISSGSSFLKWKASIAAPVLYLDGELDGDELQKRLSFLGAGDNDKLNLLCCDMLEDPFPHLATARAQKIIEDKLGEAKFLVLDNLSALAPSSNEEEGAHWILIQTWLKTLKRQGISTMFLHHAGHAGHARGTTRREDLLDLVIELKHPSDHKASEGLRLEINFGKTRRYLGQLAEPLEASLTTSLDGDGLWTYRDLEDARLAQVVQLKASGKTWRQIEDETGVPKSTAQRLWNETTASKSK
jgi:hypothetical protein